MLHLIERCRRSVRGVGILMVAVVWLMLMLRCPVRSRGMLWVLLRLREGPVIDRGVSTSE